MYFHHFHVQIITDLASGGSHVLLICSCYSLSTVLLSRTMRYFRFILHSPCPRPGINLRASDPFSRSGLMLTSAACILKKRLGLLVLSLLLECHCFWSLSVDRTRNIYIYILTQAYIYLHTYIFMHLSLLSYLSVYIYIYIFYLINSLYSSFAFIILFVA